VQNVLRVVPAAVIAGVALQTGPYASAAAFVLVLLVLMMPRTRQQLAHL
jgi:hypothetical protein